MARKAAVKYRSLRSNLVHLPLSVYAQLAQQQVRPQSIILHLSPLSSHSTSSHPPKAAYLGWSGLNAASTLAQAGEGVENVEVDPEVAMSLGWSEGTLVEIAVIHNPTKARSVSVTPLTPDDWEILEQHASFLENHLLSQLRAAQKGQELDVWVMGRTKIRIRVDDTDPSSSTTAAVLVNPDTEIYVAPRPRSSTNGKLASSPPPASTPRRKLPNGTATLSASIRMRLVPPSVAASWGAPILSPAQLASVDNGRVAVCSPRAWGKAKRKLGIKESEEVVYVKMEMVDDEAGNAEVPESEEGQDQKKAKEVEVLLVPWEEMPEGCGAIVGQADAWMAGWGKVKLSFSSKKGRSKSGKGRPVPDLSFTAPSPTTALAGLDEITSNAIEYMRRTTFSGAGSPLLLLGAKGSGKTSLAKKIAGELERNKDVLAETVYKDVGKIDPETRLATIKETMAGWIEGGTQKRPCCLILDGLDGLVSPETEIATASNPTVLADHFTRLFASQNLPPGVLVIATATDSSTLHPMLNAKHIFGETLKIPPLTKETRQDILRALVEGRPSDGGAELDYVLLGSTTEGYSASDLADLVGGSTQQAAIRCSKSGEPRVQLTLEDFTLAQEQFTPLSLRGVSLQTSDVKWRDIGGMEEPRRVLRETLEWPTRYAQIFANCPLRLRSGLLLYGYPGCGKTLIASAVAKECGLNFISVKGPEILNKYIGASEKSVRDLFERASGAKPCVLFFDEFDSIAPKRGHDSTGVTDRVVNQMLTEMDGAQGLSGVYVLAATSRPDLIDPALLRPGRLDKSILCDMPSFSDRLGILQAVVQKGKLELAEDADLVELASETEGFSGADLQAVVYNAHLEVVHASFGKEEKVNGDAGVGGDRNGKGRKGFRQLAPVGRGDAESSAASRAEMDARIETIVSNAQVVTDDDRPAPAAQLIKPVITQRHFIKSLRETRPSVAPADKKRLETIYRSFVNDRDGKMGNGDMGKGTGTRVSLA